MDLPQNVILPLERLRSEGWEPQTISSMQVKMMITIVAKEYQLIKIPKAKAKKGYIKPNDLTQGATSSEIPPEAVAIYTDDEFVQIEKEDEEPKKKRDAQK